MSEFRSPLHLGGPLGLAGLAALAGATGLFVMAGSNGAPAPATQPAGVTAPVPDADVVTIPDAATGGTDLAAVEPPAPPPVKPAELPASTETRDEVKAPIKVAQAAPVAGKGEGAEIIYIVRIKGEPEVDLISRNFKRDPAIAEQAWTDLQNRYPVLKDFRMIGASYSGEIRLAYRLPPGTDPSRAMIDEIKNRIMQVQSVSYADPDYVAHPGKDTP
ncbi:MAG: hypothetical protein R3C13_04505 [Hyphomonas sp.]|uniref:hypothetical protein n=1 Tax=Hyphomonas sp. TaxID=87 RepID=UPI00352710EC